MKWMRSIHQEVITISTASGLHQTMVRRVINMTTNGENLEQRSVYQFYSKSALMNNPWGYKRATSEQCRLRFLSYSWSKSINNKKEIGQQWYKDKIPGDKNTKRSSIKKKPYLETRLWTDERETLCISLQLT